MADRPKRIQRKRVKGWRMPEGAVYVGRPTKWGNPHDWRDWLENAPGWPLDGQGARVQWCREQAVEEFAADIRSGDLVLPVEELRGKDLVCWCPPGAPYSCHADVLLRLANAPVHHQNIDGMDSGRMAEGDRDA